MAKTKTYTVDELNEWVTMKPPSGVNIDEDRWPRATRRSFIVNHEPKGWTEVNDSASSDPAPVVPSAPVAAPARNQS